MPNRFVDIKIAREYNSRYKYFLVSRTPMLIDTVRRNVGLFHSTYFFFLSVMCPEIFDCI